MIKIFRAEATKTEDIKCSPGGNTTRRTGNEVTWQQQAQ